jgi:hypothetical protein
MPDMKVIMENWGGYITELKIEKKKAPITWAQLDLVTKAAALKAQGKLNKEREGELMRQMGDVGGDLIAALITDMVPFASTAKTVGVAIGKLWGTYAQEPDKVTADNPVLAAFNLSDGFQKLIDDRLEDEFIKEKTPEIEQMAQSAPNSPIPNMDEVIKQWLADRKIGGTTGNTVQKIGTGA